jgi:membrane associated rhomboid family serine protease
VAVFVVGALLRHGNNNFIEFYFSFRVHEATAGLQVWRWVSYQFVHGGAGHVLFNMLGLYFFGPSLERTFGSRRFLTFYLTCGAVGSLLFSLWVLVFSPGAAHTDLIGASGAVLGLLTGCAVLFPGMMIFGIIPIRIFAVFFGILYLLSMLDPRDPGRLSNACHLGGMLAAVAWIYYIRHGSNWLRQTRDRANRGAWQRKLQILEDERREVDRILAKVHEEGLQSLTRHEKKTLKRASERQRREETGHERIDKL